jgi:hypothetical protein
MAIFTSDEEIKAHIEKAYEDAKSFKTKLTTTGLLASGILNFFGMSGRRTRVFLNSLGEKPGTRYAEVGTHMGSTLFSVMYENQYITAVCCDNWSEFGGPREIFNKNATMFMSVAGPNQSLTLYDGDFRNLKFGEDQWTNIDFYNFDGPHQKQDQYDGIVKAYPGLADRFMLFVDDWNWPGPKEGTLEALDHLGVEIIHKIEITTPPEEFNQNGAVINRFQFSDWHNGIAVFGCKKTK